MTSTQSRQRSSHPFGFSRAGDKLSSAHTRYHIEAPIGRGATSTVYRAVDTLAGNRIVALKVLRYDIPTEWDTLLRLQHTAIVQIRDVGAIHDPENRSLLRPYIAMDLEAGAPLSEDMREHRKLSDSLDIIKTCGRALAYLHENGIGHFDIKPGNIFIARSPLGHLNGAKILDFGLAAPVLPEGILPTGGTYAYMSPEQMARLIVTDQSDVFSLGVVAYELLTGRHPFVPQSERIDLGRLQKALAEDVPAFVRDLEPAVPPHVALVIHKALAKQPGDRPSARQFIDLLNQPEAFEEDRRRLLRSEEVPSLLQIDTLRADGNLDAASKQLRALELEGWAFPEIVFMRRQLDAARVDAAIGLRAAAVKDVLCGGGLEAARALLRSPETGQQRFDPRLLVLEGWLDLHEHNRADATAALAEARSRLGRGALREAEWFTGIVRGIETFDPVAVTPLLTDLDVAERAITEADEAERQWFAIRTVDTLPPPPHDTLAARAVMHEHAAQRHLPVVRGLVELLDSSSGGQRVDMLADLAGRQDPGTADVVRVVLDHLEQKESAIRALRERVAQSSGDRATPIAEALQAVDDLLKIGPDRVLELQRKSLNERFDAAISAAGTDRLAGHVDALCRLGEWDQVASLLQRLPRCDAARWSTTLAHATETSQERARHTTRAEIALRESQDDVVVDGLRAALTTDAGNRVLTLALAAVMLQRAAGQCNRQERARRAELRVEAIRLLESGPDTIILEDATRALAVIATPPEHQPAQPPAWPQTLSRATVASDAPVAPTVLSRLHNATGPIVGRVVSSLRALRGRVITTAVATAAIAFFATGVYMSVGMTSAPLPPPPPVPATPVTSTVTLTVIPETTTVTIDGTVETRDPITLSAGTHIIVLAAPGYQTLTESVEATGEPILLSRTLLPLPTRVLFTSNLPASDTRLDSSPLGEPADVEGSGTAHTFTAAFPSGERVIVRFTPHAAAEPALDAVEGRSVTLVAISAFGNRITVFSAKKSRVMVNGRVKGDAGSKGLALERPTGADATLVIGDDRNRVQVTVPQTEAPLLQVHVGVASDLGSIVVTANEDGSEVSLNGHSKGVVRGGRLLLQALKPGTYTMGVAKPDFCVTPDRLTVNLPASGQADASFNVQRPVFRLGDAPPGAKVLLDGREVAAAGELGIVAGVHTLTARAPGYRDYDAQVQVACGAGTTVRLASVMKRESPERPPSLQRVPKRGALVLNLSPQQTTVAFYRRGDSGQEQLIDVALQLPVELEPGDYRLHLSAAKHAGRDITVSVRSGETSIITESLVPLERTWSPGLTAQKDGVQHASAVSLFGDDAASGDYSFRVFRQGLLTRRFFGTWIVAYRSPQDYVEFRVDDGQLQWRRGSSGDFQTIGRLTAEAQKMADERKSVLVRLHVTGGNVSHEVGGDASTLSPVGSPVQLHEGQIGLAKGSQIADFSH